jgi:hypothetical protein
VIVTELHKFLKIYLLLKLMNCILLNYTSIKQTKQLNLISICIYVISFSKKGDN